jgi:hypothetical protein
MLPPDAPEALAADALSTPVVADATPASDETSVQTLPIETSNLIASNSPASDAQAANIFAAPEPVVAASSEWIIPNVAAPAPAAESRPGLLGRVGEAIQRKVLETISPAELAADVAAVVPVVAMPSSWDAVQSPLRIDLAGGAPALGEWSASSVQPAHDWLRGFVSDEKSRRAEANAELKVTLPRVAPQLAAAGGIVKAAARR